MKNSTQKKTKKVKLIDFKQMKNIYKTYTELVKNSGLEILDGLCMKILFQKNLKIIKMMNALILVKIVKLKLIIV